MKAGLSIGYEDDAARELAIELARTLGFPLAQNHLPQLCFLSEGQLALKVDGYRPIFADFDAPSVKKRAQQGKSQGLIRACKPAPGKLIYDLTGGWGRDAAILAHRGAAIRIIERSAFMHALLMDAKSRVSSPISIDVMHEEAEGYLNTLQPDAYPDVIYIDPMHPVRQKSALVKREMQVLQGLLGVDEDAKSLICSAIGKANERVVVKWPIRENALVTPSFSIEGKTVRFDVYQ